MLEVNLNSHAFVSAEVRLYIKAQMEDLGLHMGADPACHKSPRNTENLVGLSRSLACGLLSTADKFQIIRLISVAVKTRILTQI